MRASLNKQCLQISIEQVVWLAKFHQHSLRSHADCACIATGSACHSLLSVINPSCLMHKYLHEAALS